MGVAGNPVFEYSEHLQVRRCDIFVVRFSLGRVYLKKLLCNHAEIGQGCSSIKVNNVAFHSLVCFVIVTDGSSKVGLSIFLTFVVELVAMMGGLVSASGKMMLQ